MAQIVIIPSHLIPGKLQHRFQVSPEHVGVLASARHPLKPLDLLGNSVFYLFSRLDGSKLFLQLIRVGHGVILPQLLPDNPHLLSQDVILLIFVNGGLHLGLEFLFHLKHFDLRQQNTHNLLVLPGQVHLIQNLLLHRIFPWKLNGSLV